MWVYIILVLILILLLYIAWRLNKLIALIGGPPARSDSVPAEVNGQLLAEAKEIILSSQKASASYLQRRLRIGFAQAAAILDQLEEQGIVGPANGAQAREILAGK